MSSILSNASINEKNEGKKLWGGRFTSPLDPLMEEFNESLSQDKRMWKEDIEGSKAYSLVLYKASVLITDELNAIHKALDQIYHEWNTNTFIIKPGQDEDIHTANERRLIELTNTSIGGKIHTGRSRNDQVTTDLRMYLRNQIINDIIPLTEKYIEIALKKAENNIDCIMPGFTHLQPAQPVLFAHWLTSHISPVFRDLDRIKCLKKRMNKCPLGSGALAGNAFEIDRIHLANVLNFDGVTDNSMDAVSDRDYVCDFLYWASMLAVHFSQLAEDLIIYNTMGMVTISDKYSTGSSLMPQKKNPDSLELVRAQSGVLISQLMSFLITIKGLPRCYNKDLQNDKTNTFLVLDLIKKIILIVTSVIDTITVNKTNMLKKLNYNMLATDLADYLVRKGIPFRETHEVIGKCVKFAEEKDISLEKLTLDDYKKINNLFEEDIYDNVLNYKKSVYNKNVIGGTNPNQVIHLINNMKNQIKK